MGATLAGSGAVGVMLYNLVKNESDPGFWLSVVAVACTVACIAAGSAATLALIPRISIVSKRNTKAAQKDQINLLFFSNIAQNYKDAGPSYVEVLRSMTADPEELTRQIAHQVHANATVAHRKFSWADRAIRLLLLALAMLGLLAIVIELKI